MEEEYVCFCSWDDLEQKLLYCCPECTKTNASRKTPWDNTQPIVPTPPPPSNRSGQNADGLNDYARNEPDGEDMLLESISGPRAQKEEAEYARTIIPTKVLHRPLNSQEVALYQKGRLHRASSLYSRVRLWEKIAPDATHDQGWALVCAGLLPIIGAFFYECNVAAIPVDGENRVGKRNIGFTFAGKSSLAKYQAEMVDNHRYQVKVTKFGQQLDLRGRLTSRQFDYISLGEMPYMSIAVRHLLLYLGSERDQNSSYLIYHDTMARDEGRNTLRKYQILFGMTRGTWPPTPREATTARMINITPNNTVPRPDLDNSSASWERFCDSRFKDSWEEIRMRDFQYETYKVEEQRRFRQRGLPPTHTPPGSPPAPDERPSVPPAAAEPQEVIPANLPGLAPEDRGPASRDQVEGEGTPHKDRTTPKGQHTSEQPGPSGSKIPASDSTNPDVLEKTAFAAEGRVLGQGEQSRVPEEEGQNRK